MEQKSTTSQIKLFYSPFACSFAAHVALREAGLPFTLCRVDLKSKVTEDGADLFATNPMGQVPTLVVNDQLVLTEQSAVLQFLADQASVPGLAPAWGTRERYELVRWLSFVGTEVHKKVLYPIFDHLAPDEIKAFARTRAPRPLAVLDAHLAGRDVLVGTTFTVVDGYLFWALLLMPHAGIDLAPYPALEAFSRRHRERPAVKEALRVEQRARASVSAA